MADDRWILKLESGLHDRRSCPFLLEAPQGIGPHENLMAWDGIHVWPIQSFRWNGATLICCEIPFLGKGRHVQLEVKRAPNGLFMQRMETRKEEDRVVSILDQGELFSTYHGDGQVARPYFYPLHAPGQIQVTRGLGQDEVKDHVHHRSLWISHGDVNGTNNWSDEEGHGRTVCKEMSGLFSGPVAAGFSTTGSWETASGIPLLEERLAVRAFGGTDPLRILDVELTLGAYDQDLVFGDTKEGGLLSARLASSIEVRSQRGGQITNAHGGKNEDETWGRRSPWCHYGGWVEGKRVGLAIMDHPFNPHHPTYWHVRDYGLMTANPFGISHFLGNSALRGDWTLKAGDQARFCYRVIVHVGSHHDILIRDRYFDWVSPPNACLKSVSG